MVLARRHNQRTLALIPDIESRVVLAVYLHGPGRLRPQASCLCFFPTLF